MNLSMSHVQQWIRVCYSELEKKKVIEGSDGLIFRRRSGLKVACLEIIRSLAFNVIRQRASKPPLVSKNICVKFASSGIVLEEATSARDSILLTQLRRAHGMASESEAAYSDCQPSTFSLISLCHIPLASQRSTRPGRPITTPPTGRNVNPLTRITKIKHQPEMLEVR